jgi:hypothetical protein
MILERASKSTHENTSDTEFLGYQLCVEQRTGVIRIGFEEFSGVGGRRLTLSLPTDVAKELGRRILHAAAGQDGRIEIQEVLHKASSERIKDLTPRNNRTAREQKTADGHEVVPSNVVPFPSG